MRIPVGVYHPSWFSAYGILSWLARDNGEKDKEFLCQWTATSNLVQHAIDAPVKFFILGHTNWALLLNEVLKLHEAGLSAHNILVALENPLPPVLIKSFRKLGARSFVKLPQTEREAEIFMVGLKNLAYDRKTLFQDPIFHDWEPASISPFTVRELQIARLLTDTSNPLSSKEVAGKLGLSTKTAETHRANIMRKSGSHSVVQLAAFVQTIEKAGLTHLILSPVEQ